MGFEPLRSQTNAWKFQDYKCLSSTPVDSSKLPLHLHQHKRAAFRTTTHLPVVFNHYLSFTYRIAVCLQTEHLYHHEVALKLTGALLRGWKFTVVQALTSWLSQFIIGLIFCLHFGFYTWSASDRCTVLQVALTSLLRRVIF